MKRFSFSPSILLLALVALVAPFFIGCGDDPVEPDTPGTGLVKFVHAAVAVTENVDIWVDGSAFISNRKLEDVTSYLTINEGAHEIQIVPTGTTTPVATGTLTFEADKNYTLFMANEVNGAIVLVLVEDDLTAPEAGKYHVRFINLIADSPALKVGMSGVGQITEFSNISFKQGTAFIDRNQTAPTFNVQDNAVTGGGQSNPGTPLLSKSFGMTPGDTYTLLGQGLLDGTGAAAAQLIRIKHN